MDTIDTALLDLLEQDARRTPEQVGVLLGLTPAEARARIQGLEAAGVIRGYTISHSDVTPYSFFANSSACQINYSSFLILIHDFSPLHIRGTNYSLSENQSM